MAKAMPLLSFLGGNGTTSFYNHKQIVRYHIQQNTRKSKRNILPNRESQR